MADEITWTDEAITAEFRKHLTYWQTKLRMQDMDFRILFRDSPEGSEWCSVVADNCGDNHSRAVLTIVRSQLYQIRPRDVWDTVAHELVHVMNWTMAHAFNPLEDHFAVAQMNMAKALMKRGNEELAYKWEQLLTTWFAADAPDAEGR